MQAVLCRGRRRCAPGRRRVRAGQCCGRRSDASRAEASGAGRCRASGTGGVERFGCGGVAAARLSVAGSARAGAWAAGRGGARGLGRRGGGEWRAQERGRRPGYGAAPRRKGREGEGPAGVHDREGEKEGKGKKRKGKNNGKEKWREKKRGRERDPRRDHGADRGAGRPRLAPGRVRARCAGRGEKTGMGPWEIWMSARFLGVTGIQAGDDSRRGSSSTTRNKFSARFNLMSFRGVTVPIR